MARAELGVATRGKREEPILCFVKSPYGVRPLPPSDLTFSVLTQSSVVLLLCAPGWAIKQIVNVSQLCSSADIIVQYDLAKRK